MNIIVTRSSSSVSGAEIYNLYLLSELSKLKSYKIEVITNNKSFAELLSGIKITKTITSNLPLEIGTKKELLSIIPRLIGLLSLITYIVIKYHAKPRKIILMQSMTEKIFASLPLRILNFKVIWIEHGPVFISKRSRLVKLLFLAASVIPNKIICVSNDTRHDLLQSGIKNTICIYCGIDVERFSASKETKKMIKKMNSFTRNKFIIGYLGSLNSEKGIIRFIKVASYIAKKHKMIKFIAIGGGVLEKKSKDLVKNDVNLVGRFRFTGRLNDVYPEVNLIDLMLLPTEHHEGISLSVLESIASGAIVYTKDIGGNREIISNNSTGLLYEKFNEKMIADNILCLMNNKNEITSINKRSYEIITKKFDCKKNTKEFVKLFNNI